MHGIEVRRSRLGFRVQGLGSCRQLLCRQRGRLNLKSKSTESSILALSLDASVLITYPIDWCKERKEVSAARQQDPQSVDVGCEWHILAQAA